MKNKILSFLFSLALSISLNAYSSEVTITGNSTGFKTGELVIMAKKTHTVQIENNKFKITIPLKSSPQKMQLYAPRLKRFIEFYAENGIMHAEVYKKGFLKKTHITGSASQGIMNEFKDAIKTENTEKFYTLLSQNINTLPGVDYLIMYKRSLTIDKVRELYSMINEPLKENAKDIKAYLDTYHIEAMEKGNKAFDFKWRQGEQTRNLSDFKGKYVLLNFTATACKPCWKAYEGMNELEALHGNNLKVISFHVDNDNVREAWYRIAKQKNIDFKCTSLWEVDQKKNVLEVYKINVLPTFMLLDKNGIIVDRWAGRLNPQKILSQIK
ncbi:TlpA disulfide reductase family protein [Marinifilum breve]|nr:TlpA disulfide reductase family protein [Marinifilum breve]